MRRSLRNRHQIRNSKNEIRNKSKIRNRNIKTTGAIVLDLFLWTFEFVSDFGFRISDLPRWEMFGERASFGCFRRPISVAAVHVRRHFDEPALAVAGLVTNAAAAGLRDGIQLNA